MLRIIWKMSLRKLNPLLKNPIAIIISMFQSIIWLVLFGALFSGVTKISGFAYDSYIAYMLPSIIIMNALFIGIYLGLGTISDLHSGVLQRFLVAPIGRLSIIFSELLYLIILQFIQSVVLILISLLWVLDYHLVSGVDYYIFLYRLYLLWLWVLYPSVQLLLPKSMNL